MYMKKMGGAENVHEQIVVYVFVYFILISYMYRVYTITIYDIRKYTIRVYTTTALVVSNRLLVTGYYWSTHFGILF